MNTLNNILDKVEEALNKLYEKDQYLIHSEKNNHVSERSITHKLGAYLTPYLKSMMWIVSIIDLVMRVNLLKN